MNICGAVTSFLNNSTNKRAHDEKINSGNFWCSCILTYKLDLITTISVPIRISNVISIPLIIPSTSCNLPTLELHIVQTPDAKKSHVHF
ncbi:hypothetical protein DUN18_22845 [Escherichia coli]|nr:hypothetical protein [Escherichia coli]